MAVYRTIPKIFLPKIRSTIRRQTDAMEAVLAHEGMLEVNQRKGYFARLDGPHLQNELIKFSIKRTNWATFHWLRHRFFKNPHSLLYTNEIRGLDTKLNWESTDHMLKQISQYIFTLLTFREDILTKRLPQDMDGITPLCMDQYTRVIGVHRRVCPKLDAWREVPPNSKHIIVMHRGHMFKMRVYNMDGDKKLNPSDINILLKKILHSKAYKSNNEPVGVLTSLAREPWYWAKNELSRLAINSKSLRDMEDCLFALCLDEIGSESLSDAFKQAALGDHRENFTNFNRWYGLGLEIVVSKDGFVSWISEQSLFDSQFLSIPYDFDDTNVPLKTTPRASPLPQIELLKWEISSSTKIEIEKAKALLIIWSKENDFYNFLFKGIDEIFLKTRELSPDAFIQQAILFAHFKIYNKFATCYRPISLRHTKEGRKEHPHVVTKQSNKFIEGMISDDKEDSEKMFLLEKAMQKYKAIISDCFRNENYEQNIIALIESGIKYPMTVDYFANKHFESFHAVSFATSTSNSREPLLATTLPNARKGHYVYFQPKEDGILFLIQSHQTSTEFVPSKRFADVLEECLMDMKHLILRSKQ